MCSTSGICVQLGPNNSAQMQERVLIDCAVPDLVKSPRAHRKFEVPPACDNALPGDLH